MEQGPVTRRGESYITISGETSEQASVASQAEGGAEAPLPEFGLRPRQSCPVRWLQLRELPIDFRQRKPQLIT